MADSVSISTKVLLCRDDGIYESAGTMEITHPDQVTPCIRALVDSLYASQGHGACLCCGQPATGTSLVVHRGMEMLVPVVCAVAGAVCDDQACQDATLSRSRDLANRSLPAVPPPGSPKNRTRTVPDTTAVAAQHRAMHRERALARARARMLANANADEVP